MIYLLLIGIPVALLVLFLVLVSFEKRSGRRVFAGRRYALDTKVSRTAFIIAHVDWGAFTSDIVRSAFDRTLHDIAHGSLIAVRALERQLSGTVRTLRARREHPAIATPREARPSRIESAVAYVKRTVRRSRKVPALAPGEDSAQ